LIADKLGVDNFVDASCIGATTADVLDGHTADDGEFVPAQMEDVTADTDVVSITIGGNDSEFIASLYVACYVPPQSSAKACASAVSRLPAMLGKIQENIATTIEAIREKAPHADVVLVGYPRIMPDSGSCDPDVVPISPPLLSASATVEGKLEATMRAAAKEGGAEYVDMRKRSVGHEACAGEDDAWVSGNSPKPGDGTFLHPRAKGAKAMAGAVLPLVKSGLTGK
jgi:lysophospholipase L1-like esterase